MKPIKRIWIASVLVVWLVASAVTLWWFQFRHISRFDEHWVTFKGSQIFASVQLGAIENYLVVHFVDPKCPCSRFSVGHIADLETRLGGRVEFVDYRRMGLSDARLRPLKNIAVPAGPAVGIWNKSGQLSYFGPYSGGAVCGEGEDYVTRIIDSLDDGGEPQWLNQEAVGCFCQWK